MQQEGLLECGLDMLYLASCAVDDRLAEEARLRRMDLARIYELSKRHSMQATVYIALEQCLAAYGCEWIDAELLARWRASYARELRRLVRLELEREQLLSFLREKGSWYLCLKGIVFQEYYARIGLRQMSDNDILIDETFAPAVKEYMTAHGYQAYAYGMGHHDLYHKEDLYFEIHRSLVPYRDTLQVQARYYENVTDRLIAVGESGERRFRDEDLYVYFMCHAYKHMVSSGYGVRFLMDIYAYTRAVWERLDLSYLREQLDALSISAFEQEMRAIAHRVLIGSPSVEQLNERERDILLYCLSSGTFGTYKKHAENALRHMAKGKQVRVWMKLRYLLGRVFPPFTYYKAKYPKASRWIVPIPVLWAIRLVKGLSRRRAVADELDGVKNIK